MKSLKKAKQGWFLLAINKKIIVFLPKKKINILIKKLKVW